MAMIQSSISESVHTYCCISYGQRRTRSICTLPSKTNMPQSKYATNKRCYRSIKDKKKSGVAQQKFIENKLLQSKKLLRKVVISDFMEDFFSYGTNPHFFSV